jgi:uncharacterized RDD family membrane protein YckC
VLLVMSVFAISSNHNKVLIVLGSVLFAVWAISYFAVFWTTTGQTVGSRVMQIRVTRCDGARLKPRHALVRLAGMVISLPLFWGYIPILTSARRRGVFDVMAGTVVGVLAPLPVTHLHPPPRVPPLVPPSVVPPSVAPPLGPQAKAGRVTRSGLLP